ncbi:MAG: hypothetical protein ABEJ98_03570 [Candidatus Nanohaloarchaea archaeon]
MVRDMVSSKNSNFQSDMKIIDKLPEDFNEKIYFIHHIDRLIEEGAANKKKLNERTNKTGPGSNHTVRNWLNDLEDEGVVRIEKKKNNETKIRFTEDGRQIADIIRPLFASKTQIEKEIKLFRSRYLRYPDKSELSQRIGREIKNNELSALEDYSEPDLERKKKAKEELQEIIKSCLIIRHYNITAEEIEERADKKGLKQAAEYYQENKELIEDFERVGEGRTYRCPRELENFIESREMKAPPKPFSLH